VAKLASIGISHNDLYPRNIIVGLGWEVLSVLDWDEAGPLITSREYSRRVCWDFDTHHWDYIFLAHSPDRFDFLDLRLGDNRHVQPPLVRFPPGRVIGPLIEAEGGCNTQRSFSGGIGTVSTVVNAESQGKKANGIKGGAGTRMRGRRGRENDCQRGKR
jgi:hypothetical protein